MTTNGRHGAKNLYPFRWFPAHEVWAGVIGTIAVAEVVAAFII